VRRLRNRRIPTPPPGCPGLEHPGFHLKRRPRPGRGPQLCCWRAQPVLGWSWRRSHTESRVSSWVLSFREDILACLVRRRLRLLWLAGGVLFALLIIKDLVLWNSRENKNRG